MSSQLHLSASAAYGFGGKQWIARIRGRSSGAAQFEREFIGNKNGKRGEGSSVTVDEPGLYETCDIDRKGNKDYSYVWFDGVNRCVNWMDRDWALGAAKALDNGVPITLYQRPHKSKPDELVWDVRIGAPEEPVKEPSEAVKALIEQLAMLNSEDRAMFIQLIGG